MIKGAFSKVQFWCYGFPCVFYNRLPPKFWVIFLVCKFMFFMKSSLHVFFHFSQTGTVFFICLASSFSSLIESGGFLIFFSWLSFSESKLIFIFFVDFFFLIRNICTVLFHIFTKHAKKRNVWCMNHHQSLLLSLF